MRIDVDKSIEVLGHTLHPIDENKNKNGLHNLYFFDKGDVPIVIVTQLFIDSGAIGYEVIRGSWKTFDEIDALNYTDEEIIFGPLVDLEEFPFELEESVKQIVNPEFVSDSKPFEKWAKWREMFGL